MKKYLKNFIFLAISTIIISLFFIPWYYYSYNLVGYTSNGATVTQEFHEWWSPFYRFVLYPEVNVFLILFFFLLISFPIISLIMGILSFKDEEKGRYQVITAIISVVIILFIPFAMFFLSPAR